MAELGTTEHPLRVAIIGSGPSGFYAADPLLKSETICSVDMYDRLPTPFGLVRGGVAPDHPKIRTVVRIYEKIADHERFRFFGNVRIGTDVSVEELRRHYDAIIFACGAETDRRLGIPGEDLKGSHTATSFVAWYNAHPDYRDFEFDLQQEVAVVIGMGNVAMDVARILAKTVDELKTTDIAQHALDQLAESKIREIHVIGRRGPAQAAFTTPEIKEMGELEQCDVRIAPEELQLDEMSERELSDRNVSRNMEVMRDYVERAAAGKQRTMHFRFLLSPVELKGNGRVESIVFERNKLSGEEPFRLSARGTGETIEMPCGLVFRSIGYKGIALPGVPFDERRGLFPNEGGRITENGAVVSGMYAVGWIKRGPSGIIGTNKPDSIETVQALLADVANLQGCESPDPESVDALLQSKGVRVVNFADWRKIDAAECSAGAECGKPRERFTRVAEMLGALG